MPLKRLAIDIESELHRRIKILVSKKETSVKGWLEPIIIREVEKEEARNGD